jgi:hypothetical protein
MDEQNAPLQAGNAAGSSDEIDVLRMIAMGLAFTDPSDGEVCRYCKQAEGTHYQFCIWQMAQAWGPSQKRR